MKNIWEILGIEPTKDIALIKRAFSERSKEVHPEEHPEEFMELRRAYRAACDYVAIGKEEFFISKKEESPSKEPIIEEEERVNIFTTLKLMSQEESFLAENREESVFTEVEKLLEEMQKDIEFLIIEFKRIMIHSPRSNKAFQKVFSSERYIRCCRNSYLIEMFTDILCSYTKKVKFSKTLMNEIVRLHIEFHSNAYIDGNLNYIESVQKKLPWGTGIPKYVEINLIMITGFLLASLIGGWKGFLFVFVLLSLLYGAVILILVIMNRFFME